jgi:hypothetical protein
MNVSLKRCAIVATFLGRFRMTNILKMRAKFPVLERTIPLLLTRICSDPMILARSLWELFLVPHFGFPVVRHLYLLSAVRVSFGGLS